VRGSDTVSRLGGDEFTIIIPELQDMSDAGKVSEKVIAKMAESFKLQGQEINISPSIGISLCPDDAEDEETLLKNADAAMYHAKSKGRNNYQYYTQEMNAEARNRLNMESKLRRAIDNDDFLLYYQPQVESDSLHVTGYEALIRWDDPESGMIFPDKFIPLLEDTGLIVPVGEWVLRKACMDITEIRKINNYCQSISVNLSARQFVDNTLVTRIERILSETNVQPENLIIEITETILMTESERSLQILNELSEIGLKLSLDDFGTGYSSLAYLKQFPINVIKIDRSFVQDLHIDPSDKAICEAIIAIARQLELKVVAEGVETQDQFEFMRDRNCQSIQGYFFGKPAPLSELLTEVDRGHHIA
jgi:predicted signal transduction protein with EAL and GGDEF domain